MRYAMKRLFLFSFIIVLLFSGCATTQYTLIRKKGDIETGSGYIAGYFTEFPHDIPIKNLDLDEGFVLKFKESDKIQIASLPIGDYALLGIGGTKNPFFGAKETYWIGLPFGLMRVIRIRENEVLFLGSFEYTSKFSLSPIKSITFEYEYKIDEVYRDLSELYDLQPGIRIRSFFE
jgi:hypothetical protein